MIDYFNNKNLSQYSPKRYASGEIIPFFRGFLHLLTTTTISSFLLSQIVINIHLDIRLYFFLIGKLICYGSSALLHSGYLRIIDNHLTCLMIDKIGVYISICSSGIPYTSQTDYLFFFVSYLVLYLGSYLIFIDYESIRKIIFLFYSTYITYFIGYKTRYNLLWKLSSLFYYLSLIFFIPSVLENNNTNKMVEVTLPLFWHIEGIYSCHEDFHFLLLIADILCFINSYQYLKY